MHYLAFDVSRDTVDGVLVTRSLQLKERFRVPNTREALQSFLAPLRATYPHVTAGVESTGVYQLPVVQACTDADIPCRLLNALLTRQILRHSIRKRKTDRDDAVVIAKLLIQGEGKAVRTEDVIRPACTLTRSAAKVTKLLHALHLHVRHVERILGEVPQELSDIQQTMKRSSELLKSLAVQRTDSPLRPLLETIPGIGAWTASIILAETNNLAWCHSGDALIARSGLDPRIKQSGICLNTTGRLTKRGSPHLRRALWLAASSARRADPELRAYYERKRAEGKKHTVAVLAVSRRLAQRIYAVAKRGTPYIVRPQA